MNFDQLSSTAASIRDEKARYANTANRVGTLLYNMCLAMADTDATANAANPIAQSLNQWLTTHDNLTTLDALNAALDGMNVDSPQGLHCFKCFGIPVLTYFGVLVKDTKRYVQIAVGAFTLNTNGTALASIDDTASTRNVIVRYFNGTEWQPWKPLQPQKQTSYSGNSGTYVYSEGATDNTRTILSTKMWIRQNGAYDQFLCFKHWGADNNTSQSECSQVMLPKAWIGGTGLLRWDIYRRLDNFALREENSTATEVKIVTPIFTTGGTNSFSITAATSAKAGVMTAAQATQLGEVASAMESFHSSITEQAGRIYNLEHGQPLATADSDGFMSHEDKAKLDGLADISADGAKAANKLGFAIGNDIRLFGRGNIFDTKMGSLGGKVAKAVYDSSTPATYIKGQPFEVFCSQGIDSSLTSLKYMIWFGLRKSTTNIERYDSKQVVGVPESELKSYLTSMAFRLNNGEIYVPSLDSAGYSIYESVSHLISSKYVIPSYSDLHETATTEKDGLMSKEDKALLDKIKAKLGL